MLKISSSIAFQGSLRLKDSQNIPSSLQNSIMTSKVLQKLSKISDKDIFVSITEQIAKEYTINHSKGNQLYRVYLEKEPSTILERLKKIVGLNKIYLTKYHHSIRTYDTDIFPMLSFNKLREKLKI